MNQMYYWHIQGPVINKDDEFAAYISSFEDDTLPMEYHPFFKRSSNSFVMQLQSTICIPVPVVREDVLHS